MVKRCAHFPECGMSGVCLPVQVIWKRFRDFCGDQPQGWWEDKAFIRVAIDESVSDEQCGEVEWAVCALRCFDRREWTLAIDNLGRVTGRTISQGGANALKRVGL
jgi:hypothetical protein